jgi:hypothetical protein
MGLTDRYTNPFFLNMKNIDQTFLQLKEKYGKLICLNNFNAVDSREWQAYM